jgi:hypothetical protein
MAFSLEPIPEDYEVFLAYIEAYIS